MTATASLTPEVLAERAGFDKSVHCDLCWRKHKEVSVATGKWGSTLYCSDCRVDDRVPANEWEPIVVPAGVSGGLSRTTAGFNDGIDRQDNGWGRREGRRIDNPVHMPEKSDSADELRLEVAAELERNRPVRKPANVCLCGCGSPVSAGRGFFRGHKSKGEAIPAAAVSEVKANEEKSAMADQLCKCGCGTKTLKGREYVWGHKGKAAKVPTEPKTVAVIKVRKPAAPAVDPDAQERVQISVNAAYLDHFWQGRSTAEKARMVSNFFAEAGV